MKWEMLSEYFLGFPLSDDVIPEICKECDLCTVLEWDRNCGRGYVCTQTCLLL